MTTAANTEVLDRLKERLQADARPIAELVLAAHQQEIPDLPNDAELQAALRDAVLADVDLAAPRRDRFSRDGLRYPVLAVGTMSTFALVHGAWHGAWCFERLAPALEARGHRAVAVDLPSDDATATFETYADVVARALEEEGDDVALVGHSLAGLTIPLVASRRPLRRLIYLCALVPVPGRSFLDQREIDTDMLFPEYLAGMSDPDAQGRRRWVDGELAREVLYADCDDHSATEGVERLRPQAQTPYAEPCLLDAFPETPATYVVCAEDRLVNPDWSRRIAHERLDAELIDLFGSHSPFLSRPDELAAVLNDRA